MEHRIRWENKNFDDMGTLKVFGLREPYPQEISISFVREYGFFLELHIEILTNFEPRLHSFRYSKVKSGKNLATLPFQLATGDLEWR